MQSRGAIAVVAAASSVLGVAGVSVFAQSNTVRHDALMVSHSSPPALRVYGAERAARATVTLPQNMTFPDMYRPTLDAMLERSPTFRRQCLRIAQTPTLVVRIVTPHNATSGSPKAYSTISAREDGRLVASVAIQPLRDTAELIAHELEHVIEQLDGIDLRARSSRPGSGVWHCPDGSFETVRAREIGRAVAQEMSGGR